LPTPRPARPVHIRKRRHDRRCGGWAVRWPRFGQCLGDTVRAAPSLPQRHPRVRHQRRWPFRRCCDSRERRPCQVPVRSVPARANSQLTQNFIGQVPPPSTNPSPIQFHQSFGADRVLSLSAQGLIEQLCVSCSDFPYLGQPLQLYSGRWRHWLVEFPRRMPRRQGLV
jgi:hypothetical protein